MKKGLWFLALAGLCAGPALADLPAGYQMKSDSLVLVLQAPPALVYITDGQGRKTGADPSKVLNPDGSQDPKVVLTEIPFSQAAQSAVTAQDMTPTPGATQTAQSPTPQATQSAAVTPVAAPNTGWTLKIGRAHV